MSLAGTKHKVERDEPSTKRAKKDETLVQQLESSHDESSSTVLPEPLETLESDIVGSIEDSIKLEFNGILEENPDRALEFALENGFVE